MEIGPATSVLASPAKGDFRCGNCMSGASSGTAGADAAAAGLGVGVETVEERLGPFTKEAAMEEGF